VIVGLLKMVKFVVQFKVAEPAGGFELVKGSKLFGS
jgi:hypothetical protein